MSSPFFISPFPTGTSPMMAAPILPPAVGAQPMAMTAGIAEPLGMAPVSGPVSNPLFSPALAMAAGGPPLNAASAAIRRDFEARYGFHSEDHPISQYLQGLADHAAGDGGLRPRVRVTRSWDEINALSLPDGTIVVSDRLLRFCEYEDEILFILAHEYQHGVREHSRRRLELIEKHDRGGRWEEDLLKEIGLSRIQEWEADVRGHLDLGKRGINPHGGTVFFNRLAEESARKDLAHGSPIDRGINIGIVTRLYDMAVLTTNLTPIPREIREIPMDETESDYQALVSEGVQLRGTRYEVHAERGDRAKRASFITALAAIPEIAKRLLENEKNEAPQTLQEMSIREDRKIVRTLLERLRSGLKGTYPHLAEEQRERLLCLLLIVDCGIDPFEFQNEGNPFYDIVEGFVDSLNTAKDFQALESLLTREVFERGGLYLGRNIPVLLRRVVETALEAGLFDTKKGGFAAQKYFDFCRGWIGRVEALRQDLGSGFSLDAGDASGHFAKLIPLAEANLGRDTKNRSRYFELACRQKIVLSVEQTKNLQVSFGISPEAQEAKGITTVDQFVGIYKDTDQDVIELAVRGIAPSLLEELFTAFIEGKNFIRLPPDPLDRYQWCLQLIQGLPLDERDKGSLMWHCCQKIEDIATFEALERLYDLSIGFGISPESFSTRLWQFIELLQEKYPKEDFVRSYIPHQGMSEFCNISCFSFSRIRSNIHSQQTDQLFLKCG